MDPVNPVITALYAVTDSDPKPRLESLDTKGLSAAVCTLEHVLKVMANANGLEVMPHAPGITHAQIALTNGYTNGAPLCCGDCAVEVGDALARMLANYARELHGEQWMSWWHQLIATFAPSMAPQRILPAGTRSVPARLGGGRERPG